MARAYCTTEQVYAVFGDLWRKLLADPDLSTMYARRPLRVAFILSDPPAEIHLTPDRVSFGPALEKPDVEIALETETAHRFWLGHVTLPVLLATRKMRVRGSTSDMMRLPGLLKPGYDLYPAICRAHGISTEEA